MEFFPENNFLKESIPNGIIIMNNSPDWIKNAFIYHIYPLGLTGAPGVNQNDQPVQHRLEQLYPWLDHLQWLGVNTLFLGPIFQSSTHGYDLIDYNQIDRRLGDETTFKQFSNEVHQRGMRIILDAVFNHSGRDFWAFQDLRKNLHQSAYKDWYQDVRFGQTNPMGDPFTYQTWNGHYRLPKFNLDNPAVRDYLLQSVQNWIEKYNIDGLRLDAADNVSLDFWRALRELTTALRPDFWLMGEVVHGPYHKWLNVEHLHSVTNYEAYKGLYSSLNDQNYFEIAYTLDRQFGAQGFYTDNLLYNFVDNHDVNRIASELRNKNNLIPLYVLLFTMPGVPSIYYGSEWGVEGKRSPHSDHALRPTLNLAELIAKAPQAHLPALIKGLAAYRKSYPALQTGKYRSAHVNHQQFAFWRETQDQKVLISLNSADESGEIMIPDIPKHLPIKSLNPNESTYKIHDGQLLISMPPNGYSILIFE